MTAAALKPGAGRWGPGLMAGVLLAVLAKLLAGSLPRSRAADRRGAGHDAGRAWLAGAAGRGARRSADARASLGVAMMGAQISWAEFAGWAGRPSWPAASWCWAAWP
ncbi:hypothetical protein ACRAWD_26445 [Caulobacter segnis]